LAGTGQTFSVTNTAQARIGNNGQAGSLSIANGSGGNHTVLNGTTNSITGTTSTALTGGSTTLTLNNSGASLGGAQLHNVAAGTAGTDAVNVNQLNDAVSGISGDVNRLSERAYGGIAAVAALAAIPAPADGKRHSIGAGVGTYGGENALAFGYRGAINENVSVTMGLSHNSASKTAANAGVGFSW
jgi:autotransporter adhesin